MCRKCSTRGFLIAPNEHSIAGKTLIKVGVNEIAEAGQVGVQTNIEHLTNPETDLETNKLSMCGIPQAWYGAGLLSLWSKGRVGSIPTSRAKLLFTKRTQLFANIANKPREQSVQCNVNQCLARPIRSSLKSHTNEVTTLFGTFQLRIHKTALPVMMRLRLTTLIQQPMSSPHLAHTSYFKALEPLQAKH